MIFLETKHLKVITPSNQDNMLSLLNIIEHEKVHDTFDFLGEGRRSKVWGHKSIAVKVAKDEGEPILFNDPEVLEKLSGTHPLFLKLYGFVKGEIMFYERFEGKTLEQLGLRSLEQLQFFPRTMVQEIKSALDLCLTKGIIPDDIHLGNIMVSPDSQTLKIIDVGDFYFCQKQFLHHISLKFKKTNRLYSILEETLSH